MKQFVTLFTRFNASHRYKDVGMIPYTLKKEYECSIVTTQKSENHESIDGLDVKYIKKITGIEFIDTCLYLNENSKNIDILNLYHLRKKTLAYICIYKVRNSSGKVFLKLDANMDNCRDIVEINNIGKRILKSCSLISVETKKIFNILKEEAADLNIKYIPNGAYFIDKKDDYAKENIICCVGRLGTYEKGTEILIDAFCKVQENIGSWKLYLVGSMTDDFKEKMSKLFKDNPKIKEKIHICGEINDRNNLYKIYEKSKVFCLPSRYESFGIAAVEAMSNGCFLVMSDIISVRDIIVNENMGRSFKVEDSEELAEILLEVCNKNEEFFKKSFYSAKEEFLKKFDYEKICVEIKKYIEEENYEN